jgi:hypothetical protein
MLIPFHSKAAGDFFMQETHVRTLFGLMGKTFSPQGVITSEEMDETIVTLNANLASAQALEINAETVSDEELQAPQTVSLKQRAWPLLDMMQRASKKRVDVVWGSDI